MHLEQTKFPRALLHQVQEQSLPIGNHQIQKTYWNTLYQNHFGFYRPESNDFRIISASLTPVLAEKSHWQELAQDIRFILSGMDKLIAWLRKPDQKDLADQLFAKLSPLEKEAAYGLLEPTIGLATVRADLFIDDDGLKVLEINTTIPAMQAYSDMIKDAFLRAQNSKTQLGHLSQLQFKQSNVRDLLESLLAHYRRAGGQQARPVIAIVARPGDSQLGELLWIQKTWRELGYHCELTHPENLSIREPHLYLNEKRIDVVYRHIFASYLKPGTDFYEACRRSTHFKVFNPVSAHLELKGVLAELSRVASSRETQQVVNLTEDEEKAIDRRLPWSRIINSSQSYLPYGETGSLIPWLKKNAEDLVIKSSFGYGGHQVVIGSDFYESSTVERIKKITASSSNLTWEQWIDFCAGDPTTVWIAQKKVKGLKTELSYLHQEKLINEPVFVDCSLFTSSGTDYYPYGACSRFANRAIVNLGTGGGMVPMFFDDERN